MNNRPSREAFLATRGSSTSSEVEELEREAKAFRSKGDHVAAGDMEKEAASLRRYLWVQAADEWDRQKQ